MSERHMETLLRLNLGCGKNPMPGYLNVDKFGTPDLRCDLEEFPWPWATSSVGEIVLNHVLEHLGETTAGFLGIMKEMYRVCAPNALVRIAVPHPRCDDFLNDPTHVRIITPGVLSLFSKAQNQAWISGGASNSPLAIYLDIDFEIVSANYTLAEPYASQFNAKTISQEGVMEAMNKYNNVVREMAIVLNAVKS